MMAGGLFSAADRRYRLAPRQAEAWSESTESKPA